MTYKEIKKEVKSVYKKEKRAKKSYCKKEIKQLKYERNEALSAAMPQKIADRQKYNGPKLSVLEEIGNAVTHGVGSIFSIIAFIFMLIKADSASEMVAAYVYFFGLFVLFTMSCLYHAFPHGSTVKRVFRRFDHSSIYLLIGATFSPLLLSYIGGFNGIMFLIIQWTIIAVGITLIGVFGPGRLRWLHMPLYFILGWSALLFMPRMLRDSPSFSAWIIGGGAAYTIGIIPYKIKKHASHFIWHIFVLAAAVIQWIGIYIYIYLK